MASRRLRATSEALREIGILLGILYPLDKIFQEKKAPMSGADWFWITIIELFSIGLLICGILLETGEES